MRLVEIYKLAIQLGREADPRTSEEMDEELKRQKDKFSKMEGKDKERFDHDYLWNPYADSRLLFGEPNTEIKSVAWGIDISPAEILLADRLREKGRNVDAVIGHHPSGLARSIFPDVMHVQEYMFEQFGVPINVAEDILAPRIKEVQRAVHPQNFNQSVDACRLLGMPFICVHSPCDNLGQKFVQKLIDKQTPARVSELLNLLAELPEYDVAMRHNNNPEVFVGEKNRKAGKIVVKFTGGTAGPKEMYENLSKAGVGTIVCMHIPENHIEEAKKAHMNIVVAGHMASDSIGLNLLADELEAKGVGITPFSGFIRIRRK